MQRNAHNVKNTAHISKMLVVTLLLAVFTIATAGHARQKRGLTVLASTPAGAFLGLLEVTRDGRPYYTFKGIPYAETPIRFQPSVLKGPIGGQYDATFDRSICPQIEFGETVVRGDEDCLFLTVSHPHPMWSKSSKYVFNPNSSKRCGLAKTNNLLPVMVWIHPGAYRGGAGENHGPNYMLDRCVVLVTFNYRLGPLGFLTTEDEVIPGNLGLKDQLLALHWTRNYIEYFRGDPESVTIFGTSAGGSSVGHHICSPASAGLFHRAISMSGTISNAWSVTENPKDYANSLGNVLNCNADDSTSLLACLMGKTFQDIFNAAVALMPPHIIFAPTIEPPNALNPFHTQNPFLLMKNGQINKVPYIAGFVEEEGVYYAAPVLASPDLVNTVNKYWTMAVPVFLFYDELGIPRKEKDRISNDIRQYYLNGGDVSEEVREQFVNLVSDRGLMQGVYEAVELLAQHMPTYFYVNTYKGGISIAQLVMGYTRPIITHVDDEQYIFPKFKNWTSGPNYEFSLDMVEMWTNFAKFGTPFGRCTSDNPWLPVESGPSYAKIYNLDARTSIFTNYLQERTEFWRHLGIYKYEFGY